MEPVIETRQKIEAVGAALAGALGEAALCIAVYGSAAGEEFSPEHSDVNLAVLLRDVTFADLRLVGATLTREAPADLVFATPLVITPAFLRDARDSFPIELDDLAHRHRILHGDDLLAGIEVHAAHLREEAEREARSKLLHLRALVMHRPPETEVQHALAGLVRTIALIERALLRGDGETGDLQGPALFAAIEKRQRVSVAALLRIHAMREGSEPWASGDALDDLVAGALRDVEALVAWVDAHGADAPST